MTEGGGPEKRHWPLSVHVLAAIWLAQVVLLVSQYWGTVLFIVPLSLSAFVIGRQTILDSLRKR